MTKTNFLVTALLAVLVLMACTKNQTINPLLTDNPQYVGSSPTVQISYTDEYEIPENEAKIMLNEVLTSLESTGINIPTGNFSDISTVSGENLLRNVDLTKATQPISLQLPVTAFYLFNYDNGGYAVVSADRRFSESVWCFNHEGSISSNKFNTKVELSTINDEFINEWNDYVNDCSPAYSESSLPSNQIISFEEGTNPLTVLIAQSALGDIWERPTIGTTVRRYGECQLDSAIPPMLKTHYGQRAPFNDQIYKDKKKTKKCPAGCGPIAVLQIAVYHRNTNIVKADYIDWLALERVIYQTNSHSLTTAEQTLADAVLRINNGINTVKNTDWTWTPHRRLVKYLRTVPQYANIDKKFKYDENKMKALLEEDKPFILYGFHSASSHHLWVVDGFAQMTQLVYEYHYTSGTDDKDEYTITLPTYYFHYNMGWYKANEDGWYSNRIHKDNGSDVLNFGKPNYCFSY